MACETRGVCSIKDNSKRRSNVLGVRFWYTGIRVKDLEESIRFYREGLGFRVVLKGKMKVHEGLRPHEDADCQTDT